MAEKPAHPRAQISIAWILFRLPEQQNLLNSRPVMKLNRLGRKRRKASWNFATAPRLRRRPLAEATKEFRAG